MAHYRSSSAWDIDAPVERVWDVLMLVGEWPSWWRGFRGAERLADGDGGGVGMRVRQQWRSLLPYTLVLDLEISGVERHRRLEGRTTGDMSGTCTWTFEALEGATRVRFDLDVRPTRWWMNLPLPFAGQVFAWNFAAIMRWGGRGLTRRLRTPFERTPQPEAAGA
jgi:hypothetical protein